MSLFKKFGHLCWSWILSYGMTVAWGRGWMTTEEYTAARTELKNGTTVTVTEERTHTVERV